MATKKDGTEDKRKYNGQNQWTLEQEIEQVVKDLENEAKPILKVREQEFGRRDSGDQKSVMILEQKMLEDRYLYYLVLGYTMADAAEQIGRDKETLRRWRLDPNNVTFAVLVTLAKKKSKLRAIKTIQNAILKGNLAASQWWLERRGGKEFRETKQTQVDVNINQQITVTERKQIAERFKGLMINEPSNIQEPSKGSVEQAN